ncbi:MAG TPA: hypothetical protein VFY37_03810 [Solirubrobacterales bacterium]|nr:hypothetical protein [Solirubrobacterales bacterium]
MAKTRTKRKRAVGAVACGAAALALGGLLVPAAAQAEETVCRGALGAVTVDNLLVPQGANCALTGTRVQGTIKVQRNAALNAAGVRVIGNVQGENARNVVVRGGSRVGGSVQVVQGQAATVRDSVVTQDILYDHNRAALRAISNTVGGNIQAFQNTGGVQISFNRVNGNLQCKENVPPPTGGGNVVQGNKEDQCARL